MNKPATNTLVLNSKILSNQVPQSTTKSVTARANGLGLQERIAALSRLEARHAPTRPEDKSAQHRSPGNEVIHENLNRIILEAKMERLECVIPMMETLQQFLAMDQATNHTPPGILTVNSWLGLLNRWEIYLNRIQKRQISYAKSFFDAILEKAEHSPLTPAFEELVCMMGRYLEVPS